jgi:hypothetical protein
MCACTARRQRQVRRAEAKALKSLAGMPPFHVARELIQPGGLHGGIDGNAY